MPGTALKGKLANNNKAVQEVTTTSNGTKTGLDVNLLAGGGDIATEQKQDDQIVEAQLTNAALATIRDAPAVNVAWNYYDLTYVPNGSNGEGQVQTITYYTGTAPSGTQVLQITYTYNADNNVSRVERA